MKTVALGGVRNTDTAVPPDAITSRVPSAVSSPKPKLPAKDVRASATGELREMNKKRESRAKKNSEKRKHRQRMLQGYFETVCERGYGDELAETGELEEDENTTTGGERE